MSTRRWRCRGSWRRSPRRPDARTTGSSPRARTWPSRRRRRSSRSCPGASSDRRVCRRPPRHAPRKLRRRSRRGRSSTPSTAPR
ncbi:hypothetical protein C3V38_08800 [Dietzia sp. oral taxon 368]|nr:hypothetical protein C3V38_08800 [Dietzia sp. oral taxon 368]